MSGPPAKDDSTDMLGWPAVNPTDDDAGNFRRLPASLVLSLRRTRDTSWLSEL